MGNGAGSGAMGGIRAVWAVVVGWWGVGTVSAHGGRDVGRQGRVEHGTASGRGGGAAGADCGLAIRGGAYPNRPPDLGFCCFVSVWVALASAAKKSKKRWHRSQCGLF